MIAADICTLGQWTNIFLLVGTGAVTLTGLTSHRLFRPK
jgi:hypothetical protein